MEIDEQLVEGLIDECNRFLNKYREETSDFLFSPFKGNRTDGVRRRRLDYRSARAIIEQAYQKLMGDKSA
jgi:hypothetical protein